jgi:hypothetical protein
MYVWPSVRHSARSGDPRAALGPVRLTPPRDRTYHPPDDDAPCAFWRQARLRAFRGK